LRAIEQEQPEDVCIHGHFAGALLSRSGTLLARYPWIVSNLRAFVFTLFRHPVEHVLSFYYHEHAAGRVNLPLADFLKTPHAFAIGRALEVNTEHDIQAALQSFGFIGLTEELQRSTDLLADMVGKPRQTLPWEKQGASDSQVLALSAADRRAVESLYPVECELHARVRDLWTAESQSRGSQSSSFPTCAIALLGLSCVRTWRRAQSLSRRFSALERTARMARIVRALIVEKRLA
jgi:hypothetical protein